jgi:hypothetical protein
MPDSPAGPAPASPRRVACVLRLVPPPGGRPVSVFFRSFRGVTGAGWRPMLGFVPRRVCGCLARRVCRRMPGPVGIPPPGVVSSLPSWLVSPAVYTEEDQRDEGKEDNHEYPCVGDGTGDPRRTVGDAGQHRLAPSEYLNVVRPTSSRYILNTGRSTHWSAHRPVVPYTLC